VVPVAQEIQSYPDLLNECRLGYRRGVDNWHHQSGQMLLRELDVDPGDVIVKYLAGRMGRMQHWTNQQAIFRHRYVVRGFAADPAGLVQLVSGEVRRAPLGEPPQDCWRVFAIPLSHS
jgi:hypothetical protein